MIPFVQLGLRFEDIANRAVDIAAGPPRNFRKPAVNAADDAVSAVSPAAANTSTINRSPIEEEGRVWGRQGSGLQARYRVTMNTSIGKKVNQEEKNDELTRS